ncbi:MAG TPA: ribonuclease HII [Armatimonadota bacterium]|nr:ribonuclease HII [Armatimonadota bacterium]
MATSPSPGQQTDRAARLWRIERALIAAGAARIAGVDEAGRGPLAGPVVAAAVILPVGWCPDGLNDSKQVPAETRERLYDRIIAGAVAWAVVAVPAEIIDEINILEATRRGMRAALRALTPAPDLALVDGLPLPEPPVPQQNVIKGDSHSASIAAASILAKVTRDRLLCALDAEHPGYGFARHKGYPTPEHLAALRRLGPCPAHRRSFGPVRACGQGALDLA